MKKKILLAMAMMLTALCLPAQKRQVFHTEIRTANPSPVYDFIERYFAEIASSKDAELLRLRMRDDRVEVVEGSLAAIRSIGTETPFSLNRVGDTYYQISWSEGTKTLLTLRFPVSFELLLGKSKYDIEKQMKTLITSTQRMPLRTVDEQDLERQDDGIYKTVPSQHYQLQQFSDVCFYTNVDGRYVAVFDKDHTQYSAANLFHNVVMPGERQLYVEQNLYGGKKARYTVSLSDWLSYCAANNLRVYFAVEEERTDGIQALMIARSSELNYDHMLRLIIPDSFVAKRNCIIKAVMNAFIPAQNVKSLYDELK